VEYLTYALHTHAIHFDAIDIFEISIKHYTLMKQKIAFVTLSSLSAKHRLCKRYPFSFENDYAKYIRYTVNSGVASPKFLGGPKWLQPSNSIFVWHAASQSTKWLDMLNIWGGPGPPGYANDINTQHFQSITAVCGDVNLCNQGHCQTTHQSNY